MNTIKRFKFWIVPLFVLLLTIYGDLTNPGPGAWSEAGQLLGYYLAGYLIYKIIKKAIEKSKKEVNNG